MASRPDVVIPILRSGILGRQFCERVAITQVEAVFDRCFYLRSGDDFVCIGEPDIGNGPVTLIGNLSALPTLKFLAGGVVSISGEQITIGDSVRFTLDHNEPWSPGRWPICPSPDCLIDICEVLASHAAIDAPEEGLARCITGASERSASPLARIAHFERWLSEILDARHIPSIASREAIQGLIGLGTGLTPSGDDFLVGALAALDAIGETEAHTAMARAIVDVLPGLTAPMSACFLRAAAAGHIGENLHKIVSLVITEDVDAAIATAAQIGHSSGWDMMTGIVTTLRIAAAQRVSGQCLKAPRVARSGAERWL